MQNERIDKSQLREHYERSRQRKARYEVTPPGSPWIEGVELDSIFPQDCYWQAYRYACDTPDRLGNCGHKLVHGETSLALGGHAWVELPNGIVFDGVYQRFYRHEDYYGDMALARAWYIYEPNAALPFHYHLECSHASWWVALRLPMISVGRPPLVIDRQQGWELLMAYYSRFDEERLRGVPLNILRSVAKHCGIAGVWRMKKADLIHAISQRQHTTASHQGEVRTKEIIE